MASRFELTVTGDIARLRMVWPEGRNAVDPLWVTELVAAVDALEAGPVVRALLISGDGPSFSVGGDMRHFSARTDRLAAELDGMIGGYHPALLRLAALPYPVVCAVNGGAGGGALGLVWCADVAIAAEDARFATGFAALGLSG
ncbi:MAG TPA: enoyl-CoA hydratase/isomerase family protein, partial [Acidimicrobiia bacterium]|nr:enoyl-CoA hydratase/isomerase family protein [Acidimicrobiia bacterium]